MDIQTNGFGIPLITVDGKQFALACHRPDGTQRHKLFGATMNVIPEASWMPITFVSALVPVLNQGRTSACTAFALTGAALSHRARNRWTAVTLNPFSIYAMYNGGADTGATISAAVQAAARFGIGETSVFPYDTLLFGLSKEQLQNMQRHVLTETYKLSNFEEVGTALTLGFDVVFGIGVGQNFSELIAEGVVPLPDRVIGGHALHAMGLHYSATLHDWVLEITNSWGSSWGTNGHAYIQRGHFDPKYGYGFDAYAIMYSTNNPEDVTDVPTAA